jgi:hypothetical protein
MEVIGHLHVPDALPLDKQPPLPIGNRALVSDIVSSAKLSNKV